jgi:hypothetical protein
MVEKMVHRLVYLRSRHFKLMAAKKKSVKRTAKPVKKITKMATKKRPARGTLPPQFKMETGDSTLVNIKRKIAQFTNEPDPLTIEPVQPLIQSPIQRQSGFLDSVGPSLDNEYDQADQLILLDDRVRGNLSLFAQMTARAFQGIDITQKGDEEGPRVFSEDEKAMITTANQLVTRLDFRSLYESYTKSLVKYGDVIEHIETGPEFLDEEFEEEAGEEGTITALTPLPMNQMTIIDEAGRIDDPEPTKVITLKEIYVVDEENADQTEDDPIQYPKSEILHVSLDPRTNWKDDLVGRPTFGIWSDAPLKSVIYLIEWKHNLIRNDMLWRNKMLPREHHKLNMSAFAPENYPGSTFSERLSAAKVAATSEMNLYSASIRGQQADQGYVTSTDVDVNIVEPKSTNYQNPNEMINQLDTKISGLTGTPEALSGGTTVGFSSIEFSGTFVSIRAEEMAALIGRALDRLLWKHIKAVHPAFDIKDIKRVHTQHRLILDRDLTERAKLVSILAGTKVFTPTELREFEGKEALTDIQQQEIIDHEELIAAAVATGGSSPEEEAASAISKTGNPTGNQQSKSKRINDNNSQGDRKGEVNV